MRDITFEQSKDECVWLQLVVIHHLLHSTLLQHFPQMLLPFVYSSKSFTKSRFKNICTKNLQHNIVICEQRTHVQLHLDLQA